MSVIFEARIKVDEDLNWFIELTDTVDGRVHNCLDIDEFSQKVEDFGGDYGGNIDEVKWSKDDNVSPQAMDEIRELMAKEQEEIEKLKAEAGES
ncbi:MAG: hypothetical protein U9O83_06455 [Campylobacterota bacterium]|nr:hypothetical protein [Campylobacterota bacterium]